MSWNDYIFQLNSTIEERIEDSRGVGAHEFKKHLNENYDLYEYNPTLLMKSERMYTEHEVYHRPTGRSSHRIRRSHARNKNISDINFFKDPVNNEIDSIIYYDDYKGGRRINIQAHGFVNEGYFGDKGSRIIINGKYMEANDIASFLTTKNHFNSIRLMSCRSGEGGYDSLASKLSSALKVPVKGYVGKVRGIRLERIDSMTKTIGVAQTKGALINNHLLGRGRGVNEVCKGSGRYMRSGSAVMAGLEFF